MNATMMKSSYSQKPKSKPEKIPYPQEFINQNNGHSGPALPSPQPVSQSNNSLIYFIAGLLTTLVIVLLVLLLLLPRIQNEEVLTSGAVTPAEVAAPIVPIIMDVSGAGVEAAGVEPGFVPALAPLIEDSEPAALPRNSEDTSVLSQHEALLDDTVAEALELIEEAEASLASKPVVASVLGSLDTLIDSEPDVQTNDLQMPVPESQVPAVASSARVEFLPEGGPQWTYKPMKFEKVARVGTESRFFTEWNYPKELFNKNVLTFEIISGPAWLQVNRRSGELFGSPKEGDAGTAHAVLRMSDGVHAPDDVQLIINVLPTQ